MARIVRLLLPGATAISFLLCIATTTLWIRSYWVHDAYPMFLTGSGVRVETWWGRLLIVHCRIERPKPFFVVAIDAAHVGDHDAPYPDKGFHAAMDVPDAIMLESRRLSFDASALSNAFGFGRIHHHHETPDWIVDWTSPGTVDFYATSIPLWFGWTAFALPGFLGAHRWHRRIRANRQTRAGLCESCGYDLRASPDICPECGAHPSKR